MPRRSSALSTSAGFRSRRCWRRTTTWTTSAGSWRSRGASVARRSGPPAKTSRDSTTVFPKAIASTFPASPSRSRLSTFPATPRDTSLCSAVEWSSAATRSSRAGAGACSRARPRRWSPRSASWRVCRETPASIAGTNTRSRTSASPRPWSPATRRSPRAGRAKARSARRERRRCPRRSPTSAICPRVLLPEA